ncbi:YceI family protein [Algoriphagus hitonicola]|uniref:Polyisoprenoid-binding protein YceI n=1 Tax=Algoriphagus hitonicola TaxID=435880 RepID=A0A1I2TAW3_9BACT|nr:YceI family protein [Algoriphagus hitonicola]SFG59726.1 Polyisoprenoid-binding protein YceI [Algoriphagus hitonicola]
MKLITQTGLFLASALLIVACGAPNETVETSDAQEVAEATGATLTLDPAASTIAWTGYKPAGRHFGKIPATTGTLAVEGDKITGGSFTFDITGLKIEDLEEGSEDYGKLWGHLQSDDFFDAANHPTATFEITGAEPFGADDVIADKEEFETEYTPAADSELSPEAPTHWISGNLTMRGTTKNIKFPATVNIADGTVTAMAGFNIDRTAWGLSYGDESDAVDKAKDQFIYNTVSLQLNVKAN